MDSRRHPRSSIDAWIRRVIQSGGDHLCAVSNLSLGGALIQSPIPPLPLVGELLELRLADASGEVILECEVVRQVDEQRLGVRFLGLGAAARDLLQRMIDEGGEKLEQAAAGEYSSSGTHPAVDDLRRAPAADRRRRLTTLQMDQAQLSGLVEASRTADLPALPPPAPPPTTLPSSANAPPPSPRTSSDLVKALRSATGESRAVTGSVSASGRRTAGEGSEASPSPGSATPRGAPPAVPVDAELAAALGDPNRIPLLRLPPGAIPWDRLGQQDQAEFVIFMITGARSFRDIIEVCVTYGGMSRPTVSGILARLVQLGVIDSAS